MNYADILTAAHTAARRAIQNELVNNPETKDDAFSCGFAWVTIDGTEALARHCRTKIKAGGDAGVFGSKGYPSGWQFWCPGLYRGQAMRFHAIGAVAFAQSLASNGIRAAVGQRLD